MASTSPDSRLDRPAPPSILLVDDEEAILFAVEDYLVTAGWRVVTATSSEEAERQLDGSQFAVAVLDLRLSVGGEEGGEGLALADRIRRRSPRTRIVLLTAYGSPELERAARALGIVCCLQKPQPLDRLEERLRGLVAGAQPKESGGRRGH